MSRYLFLPLLALLSLTLVACEDDPILQPQTSKGPSGGSYSRITIDTSHTGPVMNRANPSNGRNPQTF